ncbi:M20 aminoacylase family protein [Bradyrhizobium sp. B120]|uniref:M20 aminoacylase family protein n=1 Tax=Bradyrhizobium sp. B120 TaxID=3410088 RepID=UPI003B986698
MTEVLQLIRSQADTFTAIRHDLHRHPELPFDENRTSELVAGLLTDWGYQVERGISGTGVVGQLRRGNGPRAIGLRADMDALPIVEATGLGHASTKPGVMHACGHDGHTTMLLAAAKVLAERGNFNGTVNLIFQPAEEYGLADSGAARMIADGLFERYPCDAVFGMHNMPGYPQGRLVFRDGPMMASSDKVLITLIGKGGHGAVPHLAVDPVVAASSIVMALQTVVARNVNPNRTAVVTVGVLQAGTANNVIPDGAKLELTVRALDREVRELLQQRITALVHAQAESYGCWAHIQYCKGYPPLVNSSAETEFAREVGRARVGETEVVPQGEALTGSEDFAFMLEARPGCYLLVGNGMPGETGGVPVHNPGYDFNDANIPVGSAYWVMLAERFLSQAPQS